MISLSYLLAYIVSGGVNLHSDIRSDDSVSRNKITMLKMQHTPELICTHEAK
jgi:hypothetical protein